MKQPSSAVRQLIEQLYSPHQEGPAATERAVRLIEAIDHSAEWPAILPLVPFLQSETVEIRVAAAETVDHLIERVPKRLLFKLGDLMRKESLPGQNNRYAFSVPAKLTSDDLKNHKHKNVVGLISCCRNGYVREAAVIRLAQTREGKELPFLIMRLRDWVPSVQKIAYEAVLERLSPNYLIYFLDNIVLLDELKKREYSHHSTRVQNAIDKVYGALKEESNIHLLLTGLTNRSYDVRRTCAAILKDAHSSHTADIVVRLLQDKNVHNRLNVFDFVSLLSADDRQYLYLKLSNDRAPAIRKRALEELCTLNPPEIQTIIEQGLMDKASKVRAHSRWQMSKLDANFDLRYFYKNQLKIATNPGKIRCAIEGLGEVGNKEDSVILRPFFDSPISAIDRATIKALAALEPAQYEQLFLQALCDLSTARSRAAEKALAKIIDSIEQKNLFLLFKETPHRHVKNAILHLLNKTQKWDRIVYMLNVISCADDPALRTTAYQYLQSWTKKYESTWRNTEPSKKQKDDFIAAMARLAEMNAPDILQNNASKVLATCLEYLTRQNRT